jgi:hypothetical protein
VPNNFGKDNENALYINGVVFSAIKKSKLCNLLKMDGILDHHIE